MTAPSAEALNEDAAVATETGGMVDAAEIRERRNYDGMMRAQAEALNQITKQVIVTEPRPRDGLLSAMSRMEARLSVTEQSLAALDQRLGERMKGLDGDTNALGERLHGLRQRLEKFEEKQVAALAQLRLDVYNLRHPQPGSDEPALQCEEAVPASEPVIAEEANEADAVARAITYLDTARKAAIEAAERANTMPAKRKPSWKTFSHKRRWLALAVAAVLVAWFDAYVFAHYQPAQGEWGERMPTAQRVSQQGMTARAQLIRGLKYRNGVGVPLDALRAKLWIERAALRGDAVAENMMGQLSQTPDGVSMAGAIRWYETAARHGNIKAMTNLGKLYAGGWQEGTDFAKAATWFSKAAEAGDVDASFDLAILYDRGLGRSHDIAQAYRWYAIAAGSGDKHAASRATVLAGQIAPAKRDGLDRAILAFKPAPIDRAANDVPDVKG